MKKLLITGLLLLPFTGFAAEGDTKQDAAKESVVEKNVTAKKASPKKAADSVEVTLQSTITGNREQPKVLYIVPWQAPDGPESLRQGFQSDLDELFRPVERDEFLRQLKHKTVPQNDHTTHSK